MVVEMRERGNIVIPISEELVVVHRYGKIISGTNARKYTTNICTKWHDYEHGFEKKISVILGLVTSFFGKSHIYFRTG